VLGAELILTLFAGSKIFTRFWRSSSAGQICPSATNLPTIASRSVSNVHCHMILHSTETGIDGQGTAVFLSQLC